MVRLHFSWIPVLASASTIIDQSSFVLEDIIIKDVAIIGGGASGTYAAVRLREDLNTSIVVIEEKDRLGGHVNTYLDPISNVSIDYGVEAYLRYGHFVAFFERFNIPITPYAQPVQNSVYVGANNGSELTSYMPPSFSTQIGALEIWLNFTKKYADIMLPGFWKFPAGPDIPSELLLPFGELAKIHGVEAATPLFAALSNFGVGGIKDILTFYVMIAVGQPVTQEFLNSSLFEPANLSNSVLYDRAYDLLQDDVLLQSRVTVSNRKHNGVELIVSSLNDRKKLVKAKQLLFTPSPSIQNLAPFGLNSDEIATLSTFTETWSYVAVARVPGIPSNTSVYYYAPHAGTNYLSICDWPWSLILISAPGVPVDEHLFEIRFSTNYSISDDDARKTITEAVQNLTASGTLSSTAGDNHSIDFVAFQNHNSIHWLQSASELRSGIVQDVYALQGQHSTWFTGGLWGADYTGNVWAFTETVLPRLLARLR